MASKYKGVSRTHGRWQAQIGVNYEIKFLGCFDTPEEAAKAYDKAALWYHGDKAKLNFPGEQRLITIRQEQIYRLVSPDFYGLTYWAAALLMHVSPATICNELKRVKEKCPSLFPLRRIMYSRAEIERRLEKYGTIVGTPSNPIIYQEWMERYIVEKF